MSFLPFVAYATMKWPYQPATKDLKCGSAGKPPGSGMELYNIKIGEIDLDSIPPCFKSSSSKRDFFTACPRLFYRFSGLDKR